MFRRICTLMLALALALAAQAGLSESRLSESGLSESRLPDLSLDAAGPAELSGYYMKDIAASAAELGGLAYAAGDEFADNYESAQLALRGRDGKVAFIELKDGGAAYALCGVTAGMARDEVLKLFTGYPLLWEYDEELAYTIIEDRADEINSQTLVVFFDESGRVNGAWYRAAGE